MPAREALRTLPALLLADEAEAGATLALATESETITYRDLASAARRLAAGLIASGVAPGNRVTLWLPNGVDWLVAHWAGTLAGAIIVPLNTRNRPAEVRYILGQCGAAALILRDRFLQTDYAAGLGEILSGGLPDLRAVIVRQSAPGDLPSPAITWEEAERRGAGVPADQIAAASANVTPDDTHVLQYTS